MRLIGLAKQLMDVVRGRIWEIEFFLQEEVRIREGTRAVFSLGRDSHTAPRGEPNK